MIHFIRVASLVLAVGALAAAAEPKVCNVRQFGARGDGATKDTHAIQAALDACANGGVTLLEGGVFVSGPLDLRSRETLRIAKGATLAGSEDHDDYPEMEEFRDKGRKPLIGADHVSNVVIDGGGVIDGRGQSWWMHRGAYVRPRLVVFRYSRHIRMEDVTVENSPMWQIVPYYSDHLTFRNMQVLAPARGANNTDGIDPFSSTHVLIDHVHIDTGDDNIAIKSGQPGSAGPDAPSRHIVIRDCEFGHGHGLSIGSEIAGGVQDVVAERIHFKQTDSGIRIKSNRDRGNDIGRFRYRDILMENVRTPILITEFYPHIPVKIEREEPGRLTPHFHDISIQNVKATGARDAAVLVGLPESPIVHLTLRNVSIDAGNGAHLAYVQLHADHVQIHAETGAAVQAGDGVIGKLQ